MDIGSGYPPSTVNTPATGPEATGETVAVVVEAHKSNSEAITLDRIQISQYGDTFQLDGESDKKVEPPNTYNKFGKLPETDT